MNKHTLALLYGIDNQHNNSNIIIDQRHPEYDSTFTVPI